MPRLVQTSIALQVRIPGLRRLIAERRPRVEPVCGWEVWGDIQETLRQRGTGSAGEWVHLHSQWDKPRSSAIGLTVHGQPEFFLTIEPYERRRRGPLAAVPSFRVPACTASFRVADWSVSRYELLPQFHQPARCEPSRIRQIAADASRALAGALERPSRLPPHWRPIHGDLVPWNLREDERGELWLLDWEDAGWGPPIADSVRYIVAERSLRRSSGDRIAARVRAALIEEPAEAIREAARFWLQHRNFRPVRSTRAWPRQKAKDAARWAREVAAFRVLAAGVAPFVPTAEAGRTRESA